MPRLFRQSPVNGIWEGSGNVICLDVLRAAERSPEAVEAFFDELTAAKGGSDALDAEVKRLRDEIGETPEAEARRLVERLAVAFQASLLVRHAPSAVAEAFVASRIADPGAAYGSLPTGVDIAAVLERV